MASRIITKKGSGAPLASDLVHGELAVDTVNKRLYTENAGGTIIEVGTSPSTIDINAGTIDGTVIGGSSAAAGTFTTGQFNTSLNVDGTVTADDVVLNGTQPNDVSIQLTTSGDGWTIGTEYNANNDIDLVVKGGNAGSAFTEYLRITDSGDIDVTGTVTADKFESSGNIEITASSPAIQIFDTDVSGRVRMVTANAKFNIHADFDNVDSSTQMGFSLDGKEFLLIDDSGDISFYEDTGTTAKFFWDASAESLGIGTTSPAAKLEIGGAGEGIILASPDGTRYEITVANGGTLTVTAV